jgi:Kef-type K+ transport system membrane component KefB
MGDLTQGVALPLPLLMLIVFGSAKLLAELCEQLGQPAIVGEILAGVVIGPGLLNWVRPEGLVLSLADLGVMFLLFRTGLGIQSKEMVKIGGRAAVVAAAGVTMSFGLVWGVMTFRGYRPLEAAFVSAALAATSVGITAQILAARGLLAHSASQLVLAAAVIDDVCGLLVLAVVSSLARGEVHLAEIAVTLLVAAAFVVIVANWGSGAMRRLIPVAGDRLRIAEAEFAVAMCLLFGLALLSQWTGIAAIVGAFLAGMALADSVGDRVRTLVHGATELLVPFFLVGIGLRVELSALGSGSLILLTALLLAAGLVAKVAGCGLAALPMGRLNALRTGVGMIPRGEVTMLVAQLGLTLGAVSQPVFGAVVLAAVATTLIAPPLIKVAFAMPSPPASN